jgi:hypothetical protein
VRVLERERTTFASTESKPATQQAPQHKVYKVKQHDVTMQNLDDIIKKLKQNEPYRCELHIEASTYKGRLPLQESAYEGPVNIYKRGSDLEISSPNRSFRITTSLKSLNSNEHRYFAIEELDDITHSISFYRKLP